MTPPGARYPLRGEIWWTHFPTDPPDKGRRPVIVVSTDGRNCHPRSLTVLVIPLSTSIHKSGPAQLFLSAGETGLRADCVAKADSICTVNRSDMGEPVAGHRPLTNAQICRLAGLVRLAMGCVE
ncbi:MAG: type II toxin-antitoxin system PemK/MazF family toxin [Terracidiphilus sp.]|jgi:mRNA-degrading endonuclease toxin of MazEF toxin-antitoxin module